MYERKWVLCAKCGKEIDQPPGRGKSRKYCAACYEDMHSRKPRVKKFTIYGFKCECCGKPIVAFRSKIRKYCSRACYEQHRFWE